MKTKKSSSAPRDSTQGQVRYCNYFLSFPDGDVWHDSHAFVGGLMAFIKNTAIYRKSPDAARYLLKRGEYHWKDHNGVEHRMHISETPVPRKWGSGKIKHRSIGE